MLLACMFAKESCFFATIGECAVQNSFKRDSSITERAKMYLHPLPKMPRALEVGELIEEGK